MEGVGGNHRQYLQMAPENSNSQVSRFVKVQDHTLQFGFLFLKGIFFLIYFRLHWVLLVALHFGAWASLQLLWKGLMALRHVGP